MGMRKYYRELAKGRMHSVGIGNVNRKLKRRNGKGLVFWREIIFGSLAKEAEAIQLRKKVKSRKLRKLERRLSHV